MREVVAAGIAGLAGRRHHACVVPLALRLRAWKNITSPAVPTTRTSVTRPLRLHPTGPPATAPPPQGRQASTSWPPPARAPRPHAPRHPRRSLCRNPLFQLLSSSSKKRPLNTGFLRDPPGRHPEERVSVQSLIDAIAARIHRSTAPPTTSTSTAPPFALPSSPPSPPRCSKPAPHLTPGRRSQRRASPTATAVPLVNLDRPARAPAWSGPAAPWSGPSSTGSHAARLHPGSRHLPRSRGGALPRARSGGRSAPPATGTREQRFRARRRRSCRRARMQAATRSTDSSRVDNPRDPMNRSATPPAAFLAGLALLATGALRDAGLGFAEDNADEAPARRSASADRGFSASPPGPVGPSRRPRWAQVRGGARRVGGTCGDQGDP